MLKFRIFVGALLAMLFSVALPAVAAYPDKPVKLIVAYVPGGSTDIIARILSAHLSQKWGQQVIVENKPGASGMIGAEQVVRASPDGYTLLLGYTPEVSINKLVFKSMRYDPQLDLTPIALAAEAPLVLVAGPKLPIKSFKELLARKGNALETTYGSPGVGGQQHLAGEMLATATGLSLTHVPYKGTGAAVADLVGGQIDLFFATTPPLIAHIRSGKLQPLAVAGAKREKLLPDTPTFSELGYPAIQLTNWFGVFGPKGMSADLVAKISQDVTAALKSPEVVKSLEDQGLTPRPIQGKEFATFIQSEIDMYAPIIKRTKVSID
jgi:tripartite-type tricarboxylate transporter receptor subunit TctC